MKLKITLTLTLIILLTGCNNTCKKPEILFCPQDHCQEKALEELNKAKESIYFMTFSFTDDKIGDLLISKKEKIIIKGLFEKFQNSKYSEYKKLKTAGIPVKFDKNKDYMHHKVFIIDKKTVITGSYNPTKNGNENNNENMIIIHDKEIAKQYLNEFNKLT